MFRLSLVVPFFAVASYGQLPKHYTCLKTNSPIKIDGKINDKQWKQAAWTDWFVDIEGDTKPKPRFKTRVKMLWDDQYFYIAAELEEPHVWATLTEHDSVIFHDNDFEVFLNPTTDTNNYFEFEMNALNTGWDLFLPKPYNKGGKADNGWTIPGLKTAVNIQGSLNKSQDKDRGWTLEIAFPWNGFRHQTFVAPRPKQGEEWRINFSRVEWQHTIVNGKYEKIPKTPEDNWVWSPQGVVNMHVPEKWGFVRFSN